MAAVTRVVLAGALLLAASGPVRAAPSPMTRDEIIALAASGVGYSYWWGNGCWREDGADHGSCSGSCPSCTHTGGNGADCSGFAAKVWQVPGPSPVATCAHPYSTQDFRCDTIWWTDISRDDMQRGDAATYRTGGCPGSGGHILIFESGDPWGSLWSYEARGCSTGIVHNDRTLTSDYIAIRRANLVETCTDADGDGSCAPDDCDDANAAVHPGAAEMCGNGVDDDCDGATDEGCGCTYGTTRACGTDEGACVAGLQACGASGTWGPCIGAVFGPDCDGGTGADADADADGDGAGEPDGSWHPLGPGSAAGGCGCAVGGVTGGSVTFALFLFLAAWIRGRTRR